MSVKPVSRPPLFRSAERAARHRFLAPALCTFLSLGVALPALAAPPGVPGRPAGTVEGNRVALTWGAAVDDEGVAGYNVYRDDRYLTTVNGGGTRYVADLGPGTTTSFYVTAFDSPRDGSPRGYSTRSPSATFSRAVAAPTPSTPPAATRPPAVTDLRSVAASRDGVSLAWSAPSTSVVGYNVYRDGTYLTTVRGTGAYRDTRLPSAAASVAYQVVAFDAVPRFSPYSATLSVPLTSAPTPQPQPQNDDPNAPGPGTGTPSVAIGPYDRTVTETLSVQINGPSRTDRNRTSSAPSAPTGLVALLTADNWVELDWVPSVDDGRVVAYEIYRDRQLVATIDDRPDPPATAPRVQELRSLRTTSYTDCDFTHEREHCLAVGQPQPGTTYLYEVVAIDDTGLRSSFSAPLSVTMNTVAGSSAPDPASEGYRLVFGDDFDEGSLDWRTWLLKMPWGPDVSINGETQYFVDAFANQSTLLPYNPFRMGSDPEAEDGRVLRITAVPTPPELRAQANNRPYLSGVITTRSRPGGAKRYGYVEMRAKVPRGKGLLSTFYLYQPDGNQYEIDALEYLGSLPDGATQSYHYRDGFRYPNTGNRGLPHASPTMELGTGVDLSAGYHTYSVLWKPGLVIWYIDGLEVRRLSGPRVSDQPMDIVVQLVVGSAWVGAPVGVTFPVSYDIDYIRYWQK